VTTTSSSSSAPTFVHRPGRAWPSLIAALAGGLVIGWLDRSATEVQGPLLLLMAVAFLVALPRLAPTWAVAIATAAGLPIAHIVGHALGDPEGASSGMVIVLVPALIAAYVGSAIGSAMRSASSLVDRRFLIGGVLIASAALGFGPVYASLLARAQPFPWWVATLWQLVTLVAWAVASPIILRRWQRLERGDDGLVSAAEITTHVLIVAGIAAAHAIVMPIGTRALFVPLGSAPIATAMIWAFLAYLPLDALTYAAVCGVAYASDADRRARAAAVRESAARGELAVARLAGLRAQLRPHFLFNALNTASVLAARGDSDGARRVLTGLAELLRYVMRGTDQPETAESGLVPLSDEIGFIRQYLSVERERFPERLRARVDVGADAADARVPALILQPLVENAIEHGVGGRIGAGDVTVDARRNGDTLVLTVDDDGPGPPSPNAVPLGIGLANTRARLNVLYGNAATLTLEPRQGGGTSARVVLPFRRP
jgi:signal transduction histidine kinase